MLRVLTLTSLFPHSVRPYAGAFVERQTMALAARSGVKVRVVTPLALPPFSVRARPDLAGIADLPSQENWNGLEVYRPRYPYFRRLPSIQPAAMARRLLPLLRTIRRDFPFDIIDAQTFWPDGPAAMYLALALDLPFSIKARGDDIFLWCRRRRPARLMIEAAERAEGLLAVSGGLRGLMIELGLPGAKITVHHTGVDHSIFRPRDRAAAKSMLKVNGPLVISVGNLIERKGHRFAIEAAAELDGVTMWIAGGGPDATGLQSAIDELNLQHRVRLVGHVPPIMLPVFLAAADATILATSGEGLANVWVESLACGTPVVTTDVCGASEVIDRPEAGRIVARNAHAIAQGISELLKAAPDPALVLQAAERFSWEENARQLEAHLGKIVANHRSRASAPRMN